MFSNVENDLMKSISTLEQERLGIVELRSRNPHLYGYYLDWLIEKEKKLIRKYEKRFGPFPEAVSEMPEVLAEC